MKNQLANTVEANRILESTIIERTQLPYPMQYMGSKTRISEWILNASEHATKDRRTFIDLMAGTGAVSFAAQARGFRIVANDIQPYAAAVLKATFISDRSNIQHVLSALTSGLVLDEHIKRSKASLPKLIQDEKDALRRAIKDGDWQEYRRFVQENTGNPALITRNYDLFLNYYANTYFGISQAIEIDALRRFADRLDKQLRQHVVAATISAMTSLSSTTTHLAQYLKPNSKVGVERLARKRSSSIIQWVHDCLLRTESQPLIPGNEVWNLDYIGMLEQASFLPDDAIAYADPPYFKEHYSRYYHLLDTFVLYDYPELTWNQRLDDFTVGRYRSQRIRSNFGLKARVADEFNNLIRGCRSRDLPLLISYASTSILPASKLDELARSNGYSVKVESMPLLHSGQGQSGTRHQVLEYLYILQPLAIAS